MRSTVFCVFLFAAGIVCTLFGSIAALAAPAFVVLISALLLARSALLAPTPRLVGVAPTPHLRCVTHLLGVLLSYARTFVAPLLLSPALVVGRFMAALSPVSAPVQTHLQPKSFGLRCAVLRVGNPWERDRRNARRSILCHVATSLSFLVCTLLVFAAFFSPHLRSMESAQAGDNQPATALCLPTPTRSPATFSPLVVAFAPSASTASSQLHFSLSFLFPAPGSSTGCSFLVSGARDLFKHCKSKKHNISPQQTVFHKNGKRLRLSLPTFLTSAEAAVVTVDVTAAATAGLYTLTGATYPDGLTLNNIGSTSVTLTSVTAHGQGLRVSAITSGAGVGPTILIQDCTFSTSGTAGAIAFVSSTIQARRVTILRTDALQSGGAHVTAALRFYGIDGVGTNGRAGSTTEFEIRDSTLRAVSGGDDGDPDSSGPLIMGVFNSGTVTNVKRFSIIDSVVSSSVSGGRAIGMLISGGCKHMGKIELVRSSFVGTSPKVPAGFYLDHAWIDMDEVLFQDTNFTASGLRSASGFTTWSPNYDPYHKWTVDNVGSWVAERCRYVATATDGGASGMGIYSGMRHVGIARFSDNLYSATSTTGAVGWYLSDPTHHVTSFVIERCTMAARSGKQAIGIILQQAHDTPSFVIRGTTITAESTGTEDWFYAAGIRFEKADVVSPSEYALQTVTHFAIEDTSITVSGYHKPTGFATLPLKGVGTFLLKNCNIDVRTTGGSEASGVFVNATRLVATDPVIAAVVDVGVFKIVDTTITVFAHSGISRGLNFNQDVLATSVVLRGSTITAETQGTETYSGAFVIGPGQLLNAPLVEVTSSALSTKCVQYCSGMYVDGFVDFSTFLVKDSSMSATATSTGVGFPCGFYIKRLQGITTAAVQPPASEGTIQSLSDPHFPADYAHGSAKAGTSGSIVFVRSNFSGYGSERSRGVYPSDFRPRKFVSTGCIYNATGPGRSLAFLSTGGIREASLFRFEGTLFYARSWTVSQCGGIYTDHSWYDIGEVQFIRSTFDSYGPAGVTNIVVWTHLPPGMRNINLIHFEECDMTAIATAEGAGNIYWTRGVEHVNVQMVRSTLRASGTIAAVTGPVGNIVWTASMAADGLSLYAFNNTFEILPQSTATTWVGYITIPETVTNSNFTLDSMILKGGLPPAVNVIQHPGTGGAGLDFGGSVWIALHCTQRLFNTRFADGTVVVKDTHIDPVLRPLMADTARPCRFYDTRSDTKSSLPSVTPTADVSFTSTGHYTATKTVLASTSATASQTATKTETSAVSTSKGSRTLTATVSAAITPGSHSSTWSRTGPSASASLLLSASTTPTLSSSRSRSPSIALSQSSSLPVTPTASTTTSKTATMTKVVSSSQTPSHSVSLYRTTSLSPTTTLLRSSSVSVSLSPSASASVTPRTATVSSVPSTSASAPHSLSVTQTATALASLSGSLSLTGATKSSARTATETRAATTSGSATATKIASTTVTVAPSKTATLSQTSALTASVSSSPIASLTKSSAVTVTATASKTPSMSATLLRTTSVSRAVTMTATSTHTTPVSASHSAVATVSKSRTWTKVITRTAGSATVSSTNTVSGKTRSMANTPSATAARTLSGNVTSTPSVRPTQTSTRTLQRTASSTVSATVIASASMGTKTASATATSVRSQSLSATASVAPSATPSTVLSKTESLVVTSSASTSPSVSGVKTGSHTIKSTASSTPKASVTVTAMATTTVSRTLSKSGTDTAVQSRSLTPIVPPTPTPTATATTTPQITATLSASGSHVASSTASMPSSATHTVSSTLRRSVSPSVSMTAFTASVTAAHSVSVSASRSVGSKSVTAVRTLSSTSTVRATVSRTSTVSVAPNRTNTADNSPTKSYPATASMSGTQSQPSTVTGNHTASKDRTSSVSAVRTATKSTTPTVAAPPTPSRTPTATKAHQRSMTKTNTRPATPSQSQGHTTTPSFPVVAITPTMTRSPSKLSVTPSVTVGQLPTSSMSPSTSRSRTLSREGPRTMTLIPLASVAPAPVPVRRSLSAVFSALGGGDCGVRYGAFLLASIASVVIPVAASVIAASILRLRRRAGSNTAQPSADLGRGGGDTAHQALRECGACQTDLRLPRAVLSLHAWTGLAVPCHLHCVAAHAAQWAPRVAVVVLVLCGASSTSFAFMTHDAWAPAVIVGVFAAAVATALQPVLSAPYWQHRLEVVVLRGGGWRGRAAQDLLTFGVRRDQHVGVSTATFTKLDDVDFDGAVDAGDRRNCNDSDDDVLSETVGSRRSSSLSGDVMAPMEQSKVDSVTGASDDGKSPRLVVMGQSNSEEDNHEDRTAVAARGSQMKATEKQSRSKSKRTARTQSSSKGSLDASVLSGNVSFCAAEGRYVSGRGATHASVSSLRRVSRLLVDTERHDSPAEPPTAAASTNSKRSGEVTDPASEASDASDGLTVRPSVRSDGASCSNQAPGSSSGAVTALEPTKRRRLAVKLPTAVSLVRRGWWPIVGHAIAVACCTVCLLAAAVVAAPFCSAVDEWRFDCLWRCAVAAALADALLLQPLFAALCVLRAWMVSDHSGGGGDGRRALSGAPLGSKGAEEIPSSGDDSGVPPTGTGLSSSAPTRTSGAASSATSVSRSSAAASSVWADLVGSAAAHPAHPVEGSIAALHFDA